MFLKNGHLLHGGKYRIVRMLGHGGFGITYLAENLMIGRLFAVKEFFPQDYCDREANTGLMTTTAGNGEKIEKLKIRFYSEVKNLASFIHPHIVGVFECFEENDTVYYVMDYVEGRTLGQLVADRGPLPASKAVEYITEIGDTLVHMHDKKVTHFDIKPGNIMIREIDGSAVLIDFGLSKQFTHEGLLPPSTLLPAVTPGYSPLEIYSPRTINSFAPEVDIYSLGATLLFLLTASQPADASTIFNNGLEIPSYVPTNIAAVIRKAMQPSRKERYQSVKQFLLHLRAGEQGINLPADVRTRLLEDDPTIPLDTLPNKTHEVKTLSDRKPAVDTSTRVMFPPERMKIEDATDKNRQQEEERKRRAKIIRIVAFATSLVAVFGFIIFQIYSRYSQGSELLYNDIAENYIVDSVCVEEAVGSPYYEECTIDSVAAW